VRYLQAFDQVVSYTEQIRQELQGHENLPVFTTLTGLAQVKGLGEDARPVLSGKVKQLLASQDLFPATLTRAVIERDLSYRPLPSTCPLTFENATTWIQQAKGVSQAFNDLLNKSLMAKVRLLFSSALHKRLEQGIKEKFINDLLNFTDCDLLAAYLIDKITGEDSHTFLSLLERYLKKILVVHIHLSNFEPEKRTLERSDLDRLVAEFRTYLFNQLTPSENDEIQLIEIDD